MKEAIEKNNTEDKRARAKRADIAALEHRLESIATTTELPIDDARKLDIIHMIAKGLTIDDVIRDAGRKALGLDG